MREITGNRRRRDFIRPRPPYSQYIFSISTQIRSPINAASLDSHYFVISQDEDFAGVRTGCKPRANNRHLEGGRSERRAQEESRALAESWDQISLLRPLATWPARSCRPKRTRARSP